MWLETFNVKPKVVGGEHAKCGGATVSKMSNVPWPKGTFIIVVLCHRAPRQNLGRGSRIQIRGPNAAYLLAGEGPGLVFVG